MLFWNTPNDILSLGWDTKFWTHMKKNLELSFIPKIHIFDIKK
jgi:hypothetical protein